MLIEYSVENFRSIAEKTTFSMVPSRERLKSGNLINLDNFPKIKKLLKSTVIYGANASGKTNIILALAIMKNIIITSKGKNSGDKFIEYTPFVLDNYHPNQPISFEIHFIQGDTEYKYSFSFNSERILSEELYYYNNKREIPFFKRKLDDFEPFVDHEELKNLFRNTGINVLFLSKANNEYKKFGPIFGWFSNNLDAIGPMLGFGFNFQATIDYMNQSEENKQKVLNLMHYADFDICDISGKNILIDNNMESSKIFKDLIMSITSEVNKKVSLENKVDISGVKNSMDKVQFSPTRVPELKSIRKKIDGSIITKDFVQFESSGTTQFFNIVGLWLRALQEESRVIIIDEFDTRLHPDLQYYLIKLFQNPEINQKNSQLIFTSHNTRLLSTDLFRRDQIVFTEKNPETKSTELYSLYDYEKRQDRSIEKSYFQGRYGAIPDLTLGKI
jgi:AAA15 family ATPase/GTPase